MTTKTIRWQQRYENFDHAFAFLQEAVKIIKEDYFPAIEQVHRLLSASAVQAYDQNAHYRIEGQIRSR